MKTSKTIKFAALICGLFSAVCIALLLFTHIVVYGKNGIFKIISDILFSAALISVFISAKVIASHFGGNIAKTVLILLSLTTLFSGIILTPYSPCHDALDVHKILNNMLGNEKSLWYEAYMNFWINNKLTVYCYMPFVSLFKNVVTGVKFLNVLLLIGSVFLIYLSVCCINRAYGETALFILSLTAPYMLLTGPYIYLPSIFLSSCSIYFLLRGKKTGRGLFFLFTALSFVLRPTCAGFILAFFTLYLFFCRHNKYWKNILCVAFALFLCFFLKTALGSVLYKTGAHIYPSMQNSAAIWTIELGTRPNGAKTGTCAYTPFSKAENPDDIQNDFNELWNYYYNDAALGTNSYSEIFEFQNKLKQKIVNRTLRLRPAQLVKNILYKSENFFGNVYIPYYYRANINDRGIDISKNLDLVYFLYQNSVMLMFFVCMIINMIRVIRGNDFSKGVITVAGLSAIAVIIVFLLLTEVSKKYMFDMFVPMALSVALTFSIQPRCKSGAALLTMLAAVSVLILQIKSSQISIFHNAQTRLLKSEGNCVLIVDMQEKCEGNYYIKTYGGELISLNGKQSVTIYFPDDCFNAFALYMPNGECKYYSSQNIN